MYCGNCGRPVATGNKFCVGCGVSVASDQAAIDSHTRVRSNPASDPPTWQPIGQEHWLRPIGAAPEPNVAARFDTELARAAYTILAPYGLTSLEDARNAMPSDQYDYVVGQAQELAIKNTRSAGIRGGRSDGRMSGGYSGGNGRNGSARGASIAASPHPSLALAIMILGLLLAVALLWRGWDIYHAGQVIDNATSLLGRLAGSQGQQVTSFISSITGNPNDYETAGEAIMVAGMACAAGAAFAFARPKASIAGFGIAAAIALSITGSGAGDVTLFGIGAALLTGLSIYIVRKHA